MPVWQNAFNETIVKRGPVLMRTRAHGPHASSLSWRMHAKVKSLSQDPVRSACLYTTNRKWAVRVPERDIVTRSVGQHLASPDSLLLTSTPWRLRTNFALWQLWALKYPKRTLLLSRQLQSTTTLHSDPPTLCALLRNSVLVATRLDRHPHTTSSLRSPAISIL